MINALSNALSSRLPLLCHHCITYSLVIGKSLMDEVKHMCSAAHRKTAE